jgi:hypothetical protein
LETAIQDALKVSESNSTVGKGLDFGREDDHTGENSGILKPNAPLGFDHHLEELDHEDCLINMYPDLSLSREQRLEQSYNSRKKGREAKRVSNMD